MNLNPCRRHTTPINYQLLALRCGQRPLVGNGFIHSACYGFCRNLPVGLMQQMYRYTVNAPLKNRIGNYSLLIIHHSLFIGAVTDRPSFVFPLRSLRGRCRLRQMRCYYICGANRHIMKNGRPTAAHTILFQYRQTHHDGTGKPVPYERPLAAAES